MLSTTVQDGLQIVLVLACASALASAGHVLNGAEQLSTFPALEQLLGAGLSVVGMVIIAVWIATLVIALVAAVLQRAGRPATARVAARVAVICTPPVMRRLAMALVGVNLLALPAVAQASPGSVQVVAQQQAPPGPSAATPGPAHPAPAASTADDTGVRAGIAGSPYWQVTEATTPAPTPAPTPIPTERAAPVSPGWTPKPMPVDGGLLLRQGKRSTAGPSEVVVAPGDSLWSIVATHLGPSADSAEVAEAWPAWFEANRLTIGDDPSLLIPGQVLRTPQH